MALPARISSALINGIGWRARVAARLPEHAGRFLQLILCHCGTAGVSEARQLHEDVCKNDIHTFAFTTHKKPFLLPNWNLEK